MEDVDLPDEESEEESEEDLPYGEWTNDQLKAEIDERNSYRDTDDVIHVVAPGNKPELVAALKADDEHIA